MAKSQSQVALACLFIVIASLFASYECSSENLALQAEAEEEASPELGGDGGVEPDIYLGCPVGGRDRNGQILWCCKKTGACYYSPRTCNNYCRRENLGLQETAEAEASPELGGDGGVEPDIYLGCPVGGRDHNGQILWCCKKTGACYYSPRTCNNYCRRENLGLQAEASPELGGDGGVEPDLYLGCPVGGRDRNGQILWCCKKTGACYYSPRTCNNYCRRENLGLQETAEAEASPELGGDDGAESDLYVGCSLSGRDRDGQILWCCQSSRSCYYSPRACNYNCPS